MKNGKIKGDDLVTMSERAWREGGAGTEGSFSGFELNSRNKLSDVEKGPVGAVGQRRRDRAGRAHRRQRRVLRLADEQLRAAHRDEEQPLHQPARPAGPEPLHHRARPGAARAAR
jgi:hypothetical protein